MTSKHTPGPWSLESLPTKAARAKLGLRSASHRICDISVYDETDMSTARLIAAAPDMLSALLSALDALGEWGKQLSSRDNTREEDALLDAEREIRAAIAKARGES